MKQQLIILSLIALAAAALFWQQVWSIFAGMTVLEALDMIVQYILHVAVATITLTVLFGLPKIITPWMRMLRKKQRAQRRGRVVMQDKAPVMRPRKLTVDQLLTMLAPTQKIQKTPVHPPDDRVDLNL